MSGEPVLCYKLKIYFQKTHYLHKYTCSLVIKLVRSHYFERNVGTRLLPTFESNQRSFAWEAEIWTRRHQRRNTTYGKEFKYLVICGVIHKKGRFCEFLTVPALLFSFSANEFLNTLFILAYGKLN